MAMQDALLDFAVEQDSLLDFAVEQAAAPARTSTTSSITLVRPTLTATNHTIDAASRAVSFMLGFALASVLAWLMSLVSSDVPREASVSRAATKVESVAPAVESVVTIATPPPVEKAPLLKAVAPVKTQVPSKPPVQRQPAVSGYVGALTVSSAPEGAQVWINGRAAGETPIVLEDLPAGSRAIVLRRDGYSPWSASVRVVAGQRVPVRVTLKPTDQ